MSLVAPCYRALTGTLANKRNPAPVKPRVTFPLWCYQTLSLFRRESDFMSGCRNPASPFMPPVMAPFVLRFNSEINGERQRRISAAFGAPERPAHELADEFIRGLGMPRSLQEVGVAEADLERIAEYTMEDFWARTNPRPIEGPSDVMAILRTAI